MEKKLLVFLGLMAIVPFALAQTKDFPNRPIKFIAPFAPGSGADTSGRFFGDQLAKIIGQPVIIENRPGASGAVGALAVKNAPADGYTVLVSGWSAQSVNPIVIKDLPYDPIKDLKPISGLNRTALGFFVPVNSKLNTLADLVNTAKNSKQSLNVGNISAGQQLVLAWFAGLAGVKFMIVPYKNGGQMLTDLVGNQIDWAVENVPSAGALVKAGKLRVLAVGSENRHHEFRNVPTFKESGYPEFVSYGWSALYVRSETPDDVTTVLAEAMQKALATNASKEFASKRGAELMQFGPVAMRKYELDELARFRRIADAAGIKPK